MKCSTHTLVVFEGENIVLDFMEPAHPAKPTGDVAVFLHGFGSDRGGEKAAYFAERFTAKGWHFMSLDMRSHGDSSGTMAQLTLSRCMADVEKALAWLPENLKTPVLIGSSMGGQVAAWYQQQHPASTRGLILLAPAFTFPMGFLTGLSVLEVENWQGAGVRNFENEWLKTEIGWDLIEDGRSFDREELIAKHRAPTLILQGMKDDAVPWEGSLDFAQRSAGKQVELVLIKDGDHRLTDHKAFCFGVMEAWVDSM